MVREGFESRSVLPHSPVLRPPHHPRPIHLQPDLVEEETVQSVMLFERCFV